MLGERKRRVLSAIVEDYILTAEPVGSRTIARRYKLGVSPATIRNEMADLEETGYLEQPHTSAGRVPSQKGYRFYVDELMLTSPLPREFLERVRRIYTARVREVEELLHQTARILSEMTDCLGLVEGPNLAGATVHSLQLVLLRPGRALMVVVTEEGFLEHRMIEVPPTVQDEDLQRISRVLTERLGSREISGVEPGIYRQLATELYEYRSILEVVLELLNAPRPAGEERVWMGGAGNLFRQPEFRDVERAHQLMVALTEQKLIRDFLGIDAPGEGVQVVIGEEIPVSEMHACSMVSATYTLDGRRIGRLAVLGPTRMNYARVIPLVELVTDSLSRALARQLS